MCKSAAVAFIGLDIPLDDQAFYHTSCTAECAKDLSFVKREELFSWFMWFQKQWHLYCYDTVLDGRACIALFSCFTNLDTSECQVLSDEWK